MLSHIISVALQSFMAYLLIKHHCTHEETVTPDQDAGEHESETVGDDSSFETQGRHLSILLSLFWINEVYVSRLCMSYYNYYCLLRTYLITTNLA